MKVGYLGPMGSYTEDAAIAATAGAAVYIPYPTIAAVFDALSADTIDRGVVPMENVIQGPVTETLDNLYRYADAVKIIDTQVLSIEHAFGSLDATSPIQRVFSKDQALEQCSEYLRLHHPTATHVETSSTSAAIARVAQEGHNDSAAIGHATTLTRLGLVVRQHNIGNIKGNKTRFAVLGGVREPTPAATGRDATALAIYPHRDRIGLLQGMLSIISHDHGLGCLSIHSRPDTQGAFLFYLELEGHQDDAQVAACLQSLTNAMQQADSEVRVFGTYPRRAFNAPRLQKIGIIGGTGAMGRWFERFFTAAGYDVLISGRHTALTYQACATQADAVLINVPIQVTEATIREVGPWLKEGQLLLDNTSVKTQPVATMLEVAAPGVEVLGMHTVFGPSIATLRGQNIIFTPTPTSGELSNEIEAIFHKYGARVTRTTPAYHDKQMAFHQNLEHFSKILLAEMIRQHFADPHELDLYGSPNSRASLSTMGRILRGDPALYAEIQTFNLEGPALIASYVAAAQRLGQAIAAGDQKTLKDSFATSVAALGEEYLDAMRERAKKLA